LILIPEFNLLSFPEMEIFSEKTRSSLPIFASSLFTQILIAQEKADVKKEKAGRADQSRRVGLDHYLPLNDCNPLGEADVLKALILWAKRAV
jgi:hypothetical protein